MANVDRGNESNWDIPTVSSGKQTTDGISAPSQNHSTESSGQPSAPFQAEAKSQEPVSGSPEPVAPSLPSSEVQRVSQSEQPPVNVWSKPPEPQPPATIPPQPEKELPSPTPTIAPVEPKAETQPFRPPTADENAARLLANEIPSDNPTSADACHAAAAFTTIKNEAASNQT